MATRIKKAEIEYPDSDGKPVAETDDHINLVFDVRERLKARYAGDPDVYVAGNLFVYYLMGSPNVSLAPDGFVVFGVPNRHRRSYKVWEEGKYPEVVFEFTSARTQDRDLGEKFDAYRDIWKVKEYFLFDPLNEYLDPSLIGYRLVRGNFEPIPSRDGRVASKHLGITLERDGVRLALRDIKTGELVLTAAEQRAVAAEAKVAQLEAELAALRKRKPSA